MKLAIIGATGHAGSLILKEALRRGITPTAIVRSPEKLTAKVPYLAKDLFDLTRDDLKQFDVVIDAFNAPKGNEKLHQSSIRHLAEMINGSKTRLLVVGGASSLFMDEERTQRMVDGMDQSSPIYPTAYNMYRSLETLKSYGDVNWTYLSPAAYFVPDGQRNGTYQLSDDRLKKNAAGKSEISMADYAIAMLDIAEKGTHNHEHISVVSK